MESEDGEIIDVVEIHDELGIYRPLGRPYAMPIAVVGHDLSTTVCLVAL